MSALLVTIEVLALLAIAIACAWPALRRGMACYLAGAGIAALVQAGLAAGSERTLEISNQSRAYEGLEVVLKSFPVETVQAPGWHWGILGAAFCLLWSAWFWWMRDQDRCQPFGAPLALAISGTGLILLWEKAAAPIALLAPFDLALDRVLFPATLAAVLILARSTQRVLWMVLYLSLFLGLTRVLLAIFATLATRGEWGTHLDVSAIDFIADPLQRTAVELEPGSTKHLWWLVWAPHLLVMPAIYFMSLGGVGFAVMMAAKQRRVDQGLR